MERRGLWGWERGLGRVEIQTEETRERFVLRTWELPAFADEKRGRV